MTITHVLTLRARPPAARVLRSWRERRRGRRELLRLSDAMLKDIGISWGDAWREARKPFWQA